MNLSDHAELTAFLNRHGLAPNKGLGQHFLCSSKVLDKIVAAVGDVASVLEVGPGPGSLTHALVKRWPVTAVELDSRMVEALAVSAPGASIVCADALAIDLAQVLDAMEAPRAVVSNMPYNITGPLLGRISDAREHWSVAVLMMQREVGTKILAKPGNRLRGSLSVRMQAEFAIDRVCDVPPGAFLPPPKVDSVVLRLVPKPCAHDRGFWRLVKLGFAQPRKTLANNLLAAQLDRGLVEACGLSPSIRPHELTEAEWVGIFNASLERK